MELNLFQNIVNEIKKIDVNSFIQEILERFNNMEKELVIDWFEGDIVICEDRITGKKVEILKEKVQEGLKEGSFIKEENGKYIEDVEKQEEIEKRIEDKMNKLWKN